MVVASLARACFRYLRHAGQTARQASFGKFLDLQPPHWSSPRKLQSALVMERLNGDPA
jgi:hypothetical protein